MLYMKQRDPNNLKSLLTGADVDKETPLIYHYIHILLICQVIYKKFCSMNRQSIDIIPIIVYKCYLKHIHYYFDDEREDKNYEKL